MLKLSNRLKEAVYNHIPEHKGKYSWNIGNIETEAIKIIK